MIRHKIESLNIRDRYMIDDIVLCDGKPYQWTGDDYFRSQKGMELIQPIPLTKKMLNANGIHYQFENPWYQYENEIHVRSKDDKQIIQAECKYVHELQHALRLCGLNELADNFKIK